MKKFTIFVQRTSNWLLNTLQLQLFLTLIALPILIAWGLPLSVMSVISTPLFSPVFTLFLLVSSLIFFTQLLSIPNAYLCYALQKITFVWLFIIKKSNTDWRVGFIKPSVSILIAVAVLTLLIIHTKQCNTRVKRVSCLALLLVIFCASLTYYATTHGPVHYTIGCHRGILHIIQDNKKTILIDPGYLGSKPVSTSWINYTLIPAITQVTGVLALDSIIVLQLNQRSLEAIMVLASKIPIKRIYVPYYTGSLFKKTGFILMQCKHYCLQQNSVWISVGSNSHTLSISKKIRVTVGPSSTSIAYQDAHYRLLQVDASIDNNPFAIYAAKKEKCVAIKE